MAPPDHDVQIDAPNIIEPDPIEPSEEEDDAVADEPLAAIGPASPLSVVDWIAHPGPAASSTLPLRPLEGRRRDAHVPVPPSPIAAPSSATSSPVAPPSGAPTAAISSSAGTASDGALRAVEPDDRPLVPPTGARRPGRVTEGLSIAALSSVAKRTEEPPHPPEASPGDLLPGPPRLVEDREPAATRFLGPDPLTGATELRLPPARAIAASGPPEPSNQPGSEPTNEPHSPEFRAEPPAAPSNIAIPPDVKSVSPPPPADPPAATPWPVNHLLAGTPDLTTEQSLPRVLPTQAQPKAVRANPSDAWREPYDARPRPPRTLPLVAVPAPTNRAESLGEQTSPTVPAPQSNPFAPEQLRLHAPAWRERSQPAETGHERQEMDRARSRP